MLKEIEDFPGYFISEEGKVYCNLGKGNRRVGNTVELYEIKPRPIPTGYLRVYMRRESDFKRLDRYIHRLVAQAFIPNPNNYKYVNHLDTDRGNNRVENLEWCTAKQNTDYTMSVGHVIRTAKGQYKGIVNNYR